MRDPLLPILPLLLNNPDLDAVAELTFTVREMQHELRDRAFKGTTVQAATRADSMSGICFAYVIHSASQALGVGHLLVADDILDFLGDLAELPVARLLELPDNDSGPTVLLALAKQNRQQWCDSLFTLYQRLYALCTDGYERWIGNHRELHSDTVIGMLESSILRAPIGQIDYTPSHSIHLQRFGHTPASPAKPGAPEAATPAAPAQALAAATRDSARIAELLTQVDDLKTQLADSRRLFDTDEGTERQLRELTTSLRTRVFVLESALQQQAAATDAPAVRLPTTWTELEAFASNHLAGRVVVTTKALRAARGSDFENIAFAYDVLLMLARDYVPMKWGEDGAMDRFKASSARLGVTVGLTGQAAASHATRASYRVRYSTTSFP